VIRKCPRVSNPNIFNLTPYTLAGFDLTTHSSSLLNGKRRRYHWTSPPGLPILSLAKINQILFLVKPTTQYVPFRVSISQPVNYVHQGCQMVYFQSKITIWVIVGGLRKGKSWHILWLFGHLVILCGHLINLHHFWYIVPRKNLATLMYTCKNR
jgi:hypothetical protein